MDCVDAWENHSGYQAVRVEHITEHRLSEFQFLCQNPGCGKVFRTSGTRSDHNTRCKTASMLPEKPIRQSRKEEKLPTALILRYGQKSSGNEWDEENLLRNYESKEERDLRSSLPKDIKAEWGFDGHDIHHILLEHGLINGDSHRWKRVLKNLPKTETFNTLIGSKRDRSGELLKRVCDFFFFLCFLFFKL